MSGLTGVATIVAGYIAASAFAGQPPAAGVAVAPPVETAIPPVLLTNQHRQMCRVVVGDPFPPLELQPVAGGEAVALLDREGQAATVIALFDVPSPASITMLEDLGQRIAPQYSKRGVEIKAIAVQSDAQLISWLLTRTTFELPTFSDPTAAGFAQLGEKILPRVYVLDASGKVVWFDLDYSQATERELRATLDALTR